MIGSVLTYVTPGDSSFDEGVLCVEAHTNSIGERIKGIGVKGYGLRG
jgi:hypothetical protein